MIIQLITAFIGSIGFCYIFRLKSDFILPASIGGLLSWFVYLISVQFFSDLFIPTLIASATAALYAEFLARICKAPTTIFVIPAAVPLIPGRALYYTMSSAVRSDWEQFQDFSYQTVIYALGIAAGISLVWVFIGSLNDFLKKHKPHT